MTTIFSPETIAFLQQLKVNNNKPWFLAHEAVYRQHVLEPLRDLVETLSEAMLDIDAEFETAPLVNKTISRIYRDTRFSRDKSLFRSEMWITFKRRRKDWQDTPGYFFEIAPEHYRYGMGLYQASRETMDDFRAKLATRPEEFRRVIAFLHSAPQWSVEGDSYKRTRNPEIPDDLQSWYQRKTCYLLCTHPVDASLFRPTFAGELAAEFQALSPLYHYFWSLKR